MLHTRIGVIRQSIDKADNGQLFKEAWLKAKDKIVTFQNRQSKQLRWIKFSKMIARFVYTVNDYILWFQVTWKHCKIWIANYYSVVINWIFRYWSIIFKSLAKLEYEISYHKRGTKVVLNPILYSQITILIYFTGQHWNQVSCAYINTIKIINVSNVTEHYIIKPTVFKLYFLLCQIQKCILSSNRGQQK